MIMALSGTSARYGPTGVMLATTPQAAKSGAVKTAATPAASRAAVTSMPAMCPAG
jgi:hypothetical protein